MEPEATLAEQLGAALASEQAVSEFTLPVKMVGGELLVRYRALSLRETRQLMRRNDAIRDEDEQVWRLAADMLVAASLGTTAHVGEKTEELPPLGLALATKLGISGVENDRQAVSAIFANNDWLLDEQAQELAQKSKERTNEIEAELEENSQAVTS